MKMRRSPTAVDLFCGCGGISSGLRAAGFQVLAGCDIEPNYIRTFRHNFPEAEAVTDDLARLGPVKFMKLLDIPSGKLDLLAGGPPCQGFSKNVPRKNRFLDLPNNLLVRTFVEFVEAMQPKIVLMENVAEMKNGFDQTYTQEIVERLTLYGYKVDYQVLNAADYGVPQRRRRAFFLAHKLSADVRFPPATHQRMVGRERATTICFPGMGRVEKKPHVTVWEAIGDLPSVCHDDKQVDHSYACPPATEYQRLMRKRRSKVCNHKPRTLAETQYRRLASIKPGEGLKDLPVDLRPKSGYSGAYGRLTKHMVAPTITRWVFHPGSGRFGHPEDIRVLTIREAARLQGFADDFEFTGTYTQQAGQLGNAVPPLLVCKIADGLKEGLNQDNLNGLDGAVSTSMNCSIDSLSA